MKYHMFDRFLQLHDGAFFSFDKMNNIMSYVSNNCILLLYFGILIQIWIHCRCKLRMPKSFVPLKEYILVGLCALRFLVFLVSLQVMMLSTTLYIPVTCVLRYKDTVDIQKRTNYLARQFIPNVFCATYACQLLFHWPSEFVKNFFIRMLIWIHFGK